MSSNTNKKPWEKFHGPNLGYVIEQHEKYEEDPNSVDEELQDFFKTWGSPASNEELLKPENVSANETIPSTNIEKIVNAVKLADAIRTYGHLAANIYPLSEEHKNMKFLDPETYHLSEEDLKAIPPKIVWADAPEHVETGFDAIQTLKEIYTQSLAFEFSHVHTEEERNWLDRRAESDIGNQTLSKEKKLELLKRLTEVEGFETFIHKTFVGQKRFSIEGVDALVPMLDEIIRSSVLNGTKDIMVGMAHRGRLNVLAHVLQKPYEIIFSEFHHSPNKDLIPSEGSKGINYGWTGDVKYHLGGNRAIGESQTAQACLTLANNPSHLEFVDPVVEGYARAAQEDRKEAGFPKQDTRKAFSILIHGDAAFPGEGIVAETLNLSQLKGYHTGGTVHIIANNRLGFTTDSEDSRSTRYASDLAKGYEIPVVHVNADDPEACLKAMCLAYEYRMRFNKDFLIDLIGYRRFGHNEMDDPFTTQPKLYELVKKHPTVRALYAKQLQDEKIISAEKVENMKNEFEGMLQKKYESVKAVGEEDDVKEIEVPEEVLNGLPEIDTKVSKDILQNINRSLLTFPGDFHVYPKLERILKRRNDMLAENGKLDWGFAETLAFASILHDGTPIRLSGQDSERGTFAQRHLVLHDSETGEKYLPLHGLPEAKASFAVHNSPLSEGAVIGFEYGYNVHAPETLVLWEAQYGDFANAGQVIFDQFISAGRAKWGQKSGLVILLPHGYEGQGPEHSSGRLERFLTLAAESNWTVANVTSAAQYFHILRRQAKILTKNEVRPLVIMTPKSLLRNSLVASEHQLLSEGSFQTVMEQPGLGKENERVKRLVLCSGKIAVDLASELESSNKDLDWLHIVRMEQLYPFPKKKLQEIVNRYPQLKEVVWVQEEPKNMGAWTFMESKINELVSKEVAVSYIGRVNRSSPAGGDPIVHKKEQKRIIKEAFEPSFSEGGQDND
jgi:2-oxoglutarate dehydrogenase E1 component